MPLVNKLKSLLGERDIKVLKRKVISLETAVSRLKKDPGSVHLLNELRQISESLSLTRAYYYLKRLIRGLTEIRTGKINDLNINRWKEYEDILTDSLWLLEKRDRTGIHSAGYWGNFIPQIPNQLLRRFTKKGEWVLDPFLGSGTTLIECMHLGRNGIGIELQKNVAKRTGKVIGKVKNRFRVKCETVAGDSTKIDLSGRLKELNVKSVQFVLVHPPYWDIIKFSGKKNDLSNAGSLADFLGNFGKVIANCASVLDSKRYLAVVIGDKYKEQEWIPLGFLAMQEVLKHGFVLKSIIIKNFRQTKAKRSQEELWRYRALVGGFYVFKHEYIFLFRKK